MRTMHVRILVLLAFAFWISFAASAQNAHDARIVEKIDESVRVTLNGNTIPAANARTDAGRVRPDLAMTDLVLVLSRSPGQQAAFDDFVSRQYDASSSDFHRWLEPAEVGERFGPSALDIATISRWLVSHSLVITKVSKDRMAIHFGGTAAQVESAFHTEIHNLQINGRHHIANMSDPEIPAALALVVAGVKSLNDFHPRPMHRLGNKVQFNSSAGTWQRINDGYTATPANIASPDKAGVRPDFGITVSTQGGSHPVEDVSPYDFATIYNVLPLWNAGIDGTGQTIAIVGTSDVNPADIVSYRSIFGLPAGQPVNTIIANGVDPGQCTGTSGPCTLGDLFENTLDVEVSGAVAKGAQIDLVVSGFKSNSTDPVYSSASYVIENNTAKILSVSYGLCELLMGTSGSAAYNNLWETAAAEGIAVLVASGDSGAATCDAGFDSSVPYGAQFGLSVSGMASTPYNTAVGGTDFSWCKPTVDSTGHNIGCSTVTPFWNTNNNSTTGASAANYVTEVPWNDSCASAQGAAYLESLAMFLKFPGVTDSEKACNFVVSNWSSINSQYGANLSFFVNSVGGGGGASNCTVNATTSTTTQPDPTGCSGGYAKPGWQANVSGIPADGKRDIPDVSFFSGNGLWASATLVCVSATGPCLSSRIPSTEPIAQEVGGTSVAAPEMAGVMALVNQKTGAAQGNPNAELYALASKQTYSSCTAEAVKTNSSCYFNDVDTSTIATPCQAGALNCSVTHSGDTWGLLSGFSAGRGFDEATGLGSLNVANVVNGWKSIVGTATAKVTVSPSQNTLAINQGLTVAVTVSGSSGTPSGNVGLVSGGYIGAAGALAAGSYKFTIPPYSLSGGTDTLTISYGGDSTYAEASETASITVTKLTPTVTVSATPSTVGANSDVKVIVTVTGGGPTPTGSIQLSGGGYTGNCALASGTCSVSITSNSLHSGTSTMTATYGGDSDYATAAGNATLTVDTLVPTVTVTPSLRNLDTATALSVNVTVTGSGAVPTGSVQLFGIQGGNPSNGYALGGTLSNGSYTFNIAPENFYPGTDTIYAVYAGDGVYVPITATTTITVTKATPSITVTPSAASIQSNQSLTLSGTVPGVIGTGVTMFETVTASGGGYAGSGSLMFGAIGTQPQYSIVIPPGSLSAGHDTLTVTYTGDTFFNAVSTSTTVDVTQWVKVASTVTATPTSSSIDSGQGLDVAVSVTGSYGTPTGTVSLAGGGYSSSAWTLANGSVIVTVPGNILSSGPVTFTVTYNGDATYLSSMATTTSVTVNQSIFTVSAAAATPSSIVKGGSASSALTFSSSTHYSGVISLSCALTSGPINQAGDSPGCSVPSGFVQVPTTGIAAYVSTVARTTGALGSPVSPNRSYGMVPVIVVPALVFLCGIPAYRRRWRTMLGLMVMLAALGATAACGGGGGSGSGGGGGGSGGGGSNPGTASGTYTFTVTAVGNPAVTPNPTATFTVTVN